MNSGMIAFERKSRKRATAATTKRRYPARIARQLSLAHALQQRVNVGEFVDYADTARALGFSRARVTQIMSLLLLAPDIQEEILFLEIEPGAQPISERELRESVLRSLDWLDQRQRWVGLRTQLARPRARCRPKRCDSSTTDAES